MHTAKIGSKVQGTRRKVQAEAQDPRLKEGSIIKAQEDLSIKPKRNGGRHKLQEKFITNLVWIALVR